MTTIRWFVLLGVLCGLSPALSSQSVQWTEFRSEEGRFVAQFPGQPSYQRVGKGNNPTHAFTVGGGGRAFAVGYLDFPEAQMAGLGADGAMDEVLRESFVKQENGRISGEQRVPCGEHPGRRFTVTTGTGVWIAVCMCVAQTRLYLITSVNATGPLPADTAWRLQDSFRILPGAPALWKEFRSEEGRFVVQFPGQPSYRRQEDKEKNLVVHTFATGGGGRVFVVMYLDFSSQEAMALDADGAMDSLLQDFLEAGKISNEQRVQCGEHPGRRFVVTGDAGEWRASQACLAQARIYLMTSSNSAGPLPADAAWRLQDSFRILPGPTVASAPPVRPPAPAPRPAPPQYTPPVRTTPPATTAAGPPAAAKPNPATTPPPVAKPAPAPVPSAPPVVSVPPLALPAYLHAPSGVKLPTERRVCRAILMPDRKSLIVGDKRGYIGIWELGIAREVRALFHDAGEDCTWRISPDLRWLANARENGIDVWDLKANRKIRSYEMDGDLYDAAISSDGKRMFVSEEKGVLVVDVHSGQQKALFQPGGEARLALHPSGNVVAARHRNTVILWDLKLGQEIRRVAVDGNYGALTFSPDGRWLAVGGRGKRENQLIDTSTGVVSRVFAGTEQMARWPDVELLRFSPNGAHLYVAYSDMLDDTTGVHIYDVASGRLLGGLPHQALSIEFSEDGRTILVVDKSGVLQLYNAR